ncbi:HAMP domain-containing protein [Alginatibacterium sediminis]|uniref:histidine kinase n=1 Tax=Alginatibacterium sediminis TaxID=2164068 RepID=A0A420EH28_9ALTE|nr:ATP-binding protein [Alginatibacterium sediminis]RKF19970.1 HAMP domain-containing protein [Alginatibacterium sediminis]
MYFRNRIFAMSILTVSAVLALVTSLSWSRIMTVELAHLDNRLCMEAKRMLPRTKPNAPPSRLSMMDDPNYSTDKLVDDLVDKLRINQASELMLLVNSDEQGILAQSTNLNVQNIVSSLSLYTNTNDGVATKKPSELECQLVSFDHLDNQWRSGFASDGHFHSFIAVEVSATTSDFINTLRTALIVVIPFSVLLCILGAWFIASNTMRPINRLNRSMEKVTQKDLSHRLPMRKEDKEFEALINTYNVMLNRLEDSFQQTSRFTSDAAHELKTPLTVLRGKLEQAVTHADPSQLDLNAILDEVGHLSAITRKLLLLSQADSGSMALHLEPLNITELLDVMTADFELFSEDLVIRCSIQRDLIAKADSVLFRQLLNNLLVNAVRYSVHERGINIQAKQNGSVIEIQISNYCLPLSVDHRRQLFDRFYRGDPAHTQGISGSGLGLSLSREIARAHGGDLILESSNPDVVAMLLVLPLGK